MDQTIPDPSTTPGGLKRFGGWLLSGGLGRRFLFGIACLITLIAFAWAVENWRGKHAWDNYRAEWEAKGEKFDLREMVPAEVPDDENFATTPLLSPLFDFTRTPTNMLWQGTNGLARLGRTHPFLGMGRNGDDRALSGRLETGTFTDLSALAQFYRGNTNYPQAPAAASAGEVILAALGGFDPELKELRRAAKRPFSRFPIHYEEEPSWGILLPHLGHIKGLTQLAAVHALGELEEGRSEEALQDLELGLRVSGSVQDEPTLISHLVRIASLSINLQALREGLVRHGFSESQLVELTSQLEPIDLLREYEHAMRGERNLSITGLDFLRRQGWRMRSDMWMPDAEGGASPAQSFNAMPSGWIYQNILFITQMHQDFLLPLADVKTHRVSPELARQQEEKLSHVRAGPYTIFGKMLLPALNRAILKTARMQTSVDAARCACALERYRLATGKLPSTLEALTPKFLNKTPNDVIDGQPLRYRLEPDGSYRIYSIGWNQKDDGGQIAWKDKKNKSLDFTEGDWVWMMPAEAPKAVMKL